MQRFYLIMPIQLGWYFRKGQVLDFLLAQLHLIVDMRGVAQRAVATRLNAPTFVTVGLLHLALADIPNWDPIECPVYRKPKPGRSSDAVRQDRMRAGAGGWCLRVFETYLVHSLASAPNADKNSARSWSFSTMS